MVNSADFAKRLGEILDYYGITAASFSDMLAVNRSTISHLLSGRNKPSLDFVLKVLNQFPEVELYWLLNGQGHFPTQSKNPIEDRSTKQVDPVSNESTTTITHPKQIQADFTQDTQSNIGDHSKKQNAEDNEYGAIERIVVFYRNGKFKTYTP